MRLPTAPRSIGLSVGVAVGLLLSILVALPMEPAQSREPDRTLKLFFGHTGERGAFTFKRNGRYDRKELERINSFLRDWRKTESTRMDPQLLDLLWEIYQEAGSRDYIHVVSAYRSPATNDQLRRRSRGVAKNSQHTRGKAMDFALTDVPLDKLRAIAMKKQGGGVGYYPSSGYPFVHVDTGSVRAWPRMSRQQLLALFPNGETLHLPPDGKPLPGYKRAVASRESSGESTLAYLETEPDEVDATDAKEGSGVGAWLKRVFPSKENDGGDADTAPPADTHTGAREQLIAAADGTLQPRVPRARPRTEIAMAAMQDLPHAAQVTSVDAEMIATLAFAPLPRTRPDPVFLAASLGGERTGTNPLPLGGDVIALLASPSEEPAPANERAATADPVALAFAALEDAPELPAKEDSAVIAAFAALRAQSGAAPVAVAYAMAPEEPRPVTPVATARQAPTPTALETGTGGPATGIVLAPDGLPSYRADQDAMRDLITTPNYDPQLSRLEMPVLADASLTYRAPEAADAVTDLSGQPTLPVDHFATADARPTPAEQGFFMRLFASLIE